MTSLLKNEFLQRKIRLNARMRRREIESLRIKQKKKRMSKDRRETFLIFYCSSIFLYILCNRKYALQSGSVMQMSITEELDSSIDVIRDLVLSKSCELYRVLLLC